MPEQAGPHILTNTWMGSQALSNIAEKSLTSFLRRHRAEGFEDKDQHSSSNSLQGQMRAALGGFTGIQSAAEHLTAAFCEYAQQASACSLRSMTPYAFMD